ncbi:bifunctional lysylphosphatidylglycerol synthetase/lysine--tRNA ligase LysX [Millisia brevis]|uniref:bifunctional lysylphosphatidylglycerol synthetase/lysine--tRNA ligase LysX n=1 Tax=Millisia brevis TaxID=264148 RepID=UPI00082DFCCA|nr:bifunctional lysylphosphatidylglycerol synthetase/lysine--tRNA ligase LysX [Millisia brevis]
MSSGDRIEPAPGDIGLPRLAARAVGLGAWWSLLSIPLHQTRLHEWVDDIFAVIAVPVGASVFTALLLFLFAGALRRRLRVAWLVAVIVASASVAAYAVAILAALAVPDLRDGPDPISDGDLVTGGITLIGSCFVLVILLRNRAAFPARTRQGSLVAALGLLVVGVFGAVATTFLLSLVGGGTLHGPGERAWWAVRRTIGISLPFGSDGGHAGGAPVGFIGGVLAALALLAAIAIYLRSARSSELLGPDDELRVRALIAATGDQDSLSYFATRRDKSVAFAPDGAAAVTYRVVGQVVLASGDPLGPPAAWPGAIDAWLRRAHQHAWQPAVLAASESGAKAYVAAGLRARPLGDEAILDVEDFTLEGRAMRPVKRAVTRVRDAGYTITIRRHADMSADEIATLGRLADAWRGDEPDRGFSMALGRIGDRADGRCVAVIATDADGHPRALQSFVPWGTRGLSLDLMRRAPDAVNGVNEAIVAALVEVAPDLGVRRISLNFAVFRSVFFEAEQVGAGPLVLAAEKILGVANRFWQLDSLYRANAKYLPRWEPRFVCYDSTSALPRVGIAAGIAEGFLPGRSPRVTRGGEDPVDDPNGGPARPFADLVLEQDTALLTPARPIRRLTEQQQVRHDKLAVLTAAGMDPYPVAVPRSGSIGAAVVSPVGTPVCVVGRVRAVRDLGGVVFAVLEEQGSEIQALLSADTTPESLMSLWRRAVDLGDRVSVTGTIGHSRRGELSVLVTTWCMASKCLRPIPDQRVGFTDPEVRVRQRHLDLIVNRDSMEMLLARSRAIAAIRRYFASEGYVEVETPMLQAVHGGATARPFRTHINAYDADLYLRIAPELFLKRLCVGGMDRVFELNRNFRNEGADATHNPEFTSVEAYAAYGDYVSMRILTRALILEVATAVNGEPVVVHTHSDGSTERIRLDDEWRVVTVHEAASQATGVTLTSASSIEEVRAAADRHGVRHTAAMTAGEIVLEIYDALVEKQTTLPTFYTDFPLETSPLTRRHRTDPALSERWDLVAFGAEIGTAYSELIDPVDQRERLVEQSLKAAAGDPEAMEVDEAFLTALEYAMAPTGGLGIGVDRLVMMLTGATIRNTLAFPFVKPAESEG